MSFRLLLLWLIAVMVSVSTAAMAQQKQKKSASKQGNDATIWINTPAAGSLPASVGHHTYFSKSMGHDVG